MEESILHFAVPPAVREGRLGEARMEESILHFAMPPVQGGRLGVGAGVLLCETLPLVRETVGRHGGTARCPPGRLSATFLSIRVV